MSVGTRTALFQKSLKSLQETTQFVEELESEWNKISTERQKLEEEKEKFREEKRLFLEEKSKTQEEWKQIVKWKSEMSKQQQQPQPQQPLQPQQPQQQPQQQSQSQPLQPQPQQPQPLHPQQPQPLQSQQQPEQVNGNSIQEKLISPVRPGQPQSLYDELKGHFQELLTKLISLTSEITGSKKNQLPLDKEKALIALKGIKGKMTEISDILGKNTTGEIYIRTNITSCMKNLVIATKLAMEGDFADLEKGINELKYHAKMLIEIVKNNNNSINIPSESEMEKKNSSIGWVGLYTRFIQKSTSN